MKDSTQESEISIIERVCEKFDKRTKIVGISFARVELAKALVESDGGGYYLNKKFF